MTRLKISDRQDLVDLVTGCCFMGTGGGGSLMMGLKLLERAWDKGFKIEFLPPDDVPDQAWTCTGSFVGSIAPPPPELLDMEDTLALRRTVEHEIVQAVKELKEYLDIEVYALAACELGGLNTPAPISAAAELGIPVLDGDYVGRAIPGSVHLKLSIAGKELWPRVFCDRAGNVSIRKSKQQTR